MFTFLYLPVFLGSMLGCACAKIKQQQGNMPYQSNDMPVPQQSYFESQKQQKEVSLQYQSTPVQKDK